MCMCWRNDAYLRVSFPFITYIIYNPFYASIFLTSTVCVFLCFNLCSAFEYCYRYQRFTNKLLLLLSLKDILVPSFYINGSRLTAVSKKVYLGYIISSNDRDDFAIQKECRAVCYRHSA